jgi:hypothetical protein
MTARSTGVRFQVQHVHCRHCGEAIEVSIPDGLSPDQQLAECERQAEAHVCPKKEQDDAAH